MKPTIVISLGDPAGIGPEILVKALADPTVREMAIFVITGDRKIILRAAETAGVEIPLEKLHQMEELEFLEDGIYCWLSKVGRREGFKAGEPSAETGEAALKYLQEAIGLVQTGHVGAIVTGPVSKIYIKTEKTQFSGQTEILSKAFDCPRAVMMMACPQLRVALVTTHLPVAELPRAITTERILSTIRVSADGLKKYFGFNAPKIGVLGLNPHAGEEGLCGREDVDIIKPAIQSAREEGFNVTGPLSADTAYRSALGGAYDAVVAMYHDQALIPVKTIAFESTVNVTLGLPVLRTSPDHGPAFDIAGKNIADPRSMIEAIRLAAHAAKLSLR